jgi:hypothetical protein
MSIAGFDPVGLFGGVMQGYEALVVIPVALVLTFLLIQVKAKWSRKAMEACLKENRIGAVVEKANGIPPLRFWLRNRKSDSWCRLRYDEGSIKWARLRATFGGRKVELFD